MKPVLLGWLLRPLWLTTIIGAFIGLRLVGMHRGRRVRRSHTWVTVVFAALLLAVIFFLMLLPFITQENQS